METLKEYVFKRLDNYDLDKQAIIKVVLQYINADNIKVSDYCKFVLKKDIKEISSKELIRGMIKNSPFSYSVNKMNYNHDYKVPTKKMVLSFNDEFEKDEIYD
ncbi:MAG: hypothetical protein J6O56_02590 [Bacilli bacterium]|nr:hypothetical protein [Bacilli bacterium]